MAPRDNECVSEHTARLAVLERKSVEVERTLEHVEAIRTDVAVLKNSMHDLVDRMDRHGRAVNDLGRMFNDKLDEHARVLFGNGEAPGLVRKVAETHDYVSQQKNNFNSRWNQFLNLLIASGVGALLVMVGLKH